MLFADFPLIRKRGRPTIRGADFIDFMIAFCEHLAKEASSTIKTKLIAETRRPQDARKKTMNSIDRKDGFVAYTWGADVDEYNGKSISGMSLWEVLFWQIAGLGQQGAFE